MTQFPVPYYPVPKCLNPLKMKHWCLVLYWIYCYPSALKYYLYRAAPNLYRNDNKQGLWRYLKTRACRNLYLCFGPSILLVAFSLSLALLLATRGLDIAWAYWLVGLGVGLLIGLVHLVIMTFAMSAMSNGAGVCAGIIVGVATGISNGVICAVLLGSSPTWSFNDLTLSETGILGTSFFLLYSLAVAVPLIISIEGIVGSIAGCFTGLISGLSCVLLLKVIATTVPSAKVVGLIFATIVGFSCLGSYGSSFSIAFALACELGGGIVMGLAVVTRNYQASGNLAVSFFYGILATLILWAGVIRLPLHLLYSVYILLGIFLNRFESGRFIKRFTSSHPVAWDELLILPLPGSQPYLEQVLQQDEPKGFRLLLGLAKNPLQRAMIQRVFKRHMLQKNEFIRALYSFLKNPVGHAYISPPMSAVDWDLLPTGQQVMLGELSGKWVRCTAEKLSFKAESFLVSLTWLYRDHKDYAYVDFARVLYRLAYTFKTYTHDSNLGELAPKYNELSHRPGGQEIIESFKAIVKFSSYSDTNQLAEAGHMVGLLPSPANAIRPDIIQTLTALADIAHDISVAESSRSLLLQQSSLLRANNALAQLRQHTVSKIKLPEARLLEIVVGKWQRLVTEMGGEVGDLSRKLPLLKNPYTIGTPVRGEDFIGRDDILRYITDELLAGTKQCPSIVLYGHRRMGKTSILKNLSSRLKSTNIKVVDFNMQILGHVSSTNELLYALAKQLQRSLDDPNLTAGLTVDRAAFMEQNPYFALDNYFQSLEKSISVHANNYRFVVAVDEFEKIEQKIINQQLSADLLEFLRGLTQTYCWFSMVFAGLHTIEEMCFDYWNPFFTSIPIRVSFLEDKAVEQLILQAGDIAYDSSVIPKVIELTNGQPYLVQLIGYTLIRFFNLNKLRKVIKAGEYPVFNADDLETLIQSPEFYSIGNAYFQGVWLQAHHGQPPGQTNILQALAGEQKSKEQLIASVSLSVETICEALDTLQLHDVIQCKQGYYSYTVELMCRWVRATHPID